MRENEIARQVVDVAFQLHTKLGPGLLESVYQKIMAHERKRGFLVETEVPIPVRWENILFEEGFRADLLANRKVVIELKSVEKTHPVHKKVLLTYLRLTDCKKRPVDQLWPGEDQGWYFARSEWTRRGDAAGVNLGVFAP